MSVRRVDFNVKDFECLLEQRGQRFTWEKATKCFCARVDGTTDVDCAACRGQGWFYFDDQEVRVLVQTLSSSEAFKHMAVHGDWVLGKVSITSPAKHNLAFRDRITALDSQITYSELIFKGTDETLRYPAQEIIFLGVEGTTFVEGTDYSLVNGAIVWVPASEPVDGTTVTIRYIAHPRYIILDAVHEIRDTRISPDIYCRMPRNHIAALDYIFQYEQP